MYRSAELSKFEKINLEHSTNGSILPSRPDLPLDQGSAQLFQGLLLAVVTSFTLAAATLVAFVY